MESSARPPFVIDVPRSPNLDTYLTHYYVVTVEGTEIAIGEAGEVSQLASDVWHGHVAKWLVTGVDGGIKVYRGVLSEAHWDTIRGPGAALVPKAAYTGAFLGD